MVVGTTVDSDFKVIQPTFNMKFIVAILFAAIVAECYSAAINTAVESAAVEQGERAKKSASYGGSSYGGSSYAAPPCPKNYLFSCQPAVQPVGCAPSYGGSYGGSAGAYSENMPQYAFPQHQYEPLIREVY